MCFRTSSSGAGAWVRVRRRMTTDSRGLYVTQEQTFVDGLGHLGKVPQPDLIIFYESSKLRAPLRPIEPIVDRRFSDLIDGQDRIWRSRSRSLFSFGGARNHLWKS